MSHSSFESGSDSEGDHSRSATPAYPHYSPYNQPITHQPEPSPDNSDEDDDDDDSDDDDDDSDQESDSAPAPAPIPVPQAPALVQAQSEVSLPLPTYNFTKANPRPPLQAPQAQGLMRVLVGNELRKVGYETADEEALDALVGAVDELLEDLMVQSMLLAEHARRSRPNPKDVIAACRSGGIARVPLDDNRKPKIRSLEAQLIETLERSKAAGPPTLPFIRYDQKPEDPPQPHLDSDPDSEPDASELLPGAVKKPHRRTRKQVAQTHGAPYLPPLPAQHAWQHTPVFPISDLSAAAPPPPPLQLQKPSPAALAHLATLRARLANSALVASSLRSLMRATSVRGLAAAAHNLDQNQVEEEGDVVDYEGEWYGRGKERVGVGRGKGEAGKRKVVVVRLGEELYKDEEDEEERKGGGAAKRVKWRV